MDPSGRKKLLLAAAAVYLVMVLLAVGLLGLKRQALRFHTRDYNYFVEQAARLADPRLTNRFALNIEGYNFLGLQGIEGVKNLYHAIHAEYFRYTYAVIYRLFGSPLPLYLFYSLVFFAPLLYFAWLPRPTTPQSWQPVVAFILLFCLFPATLYTVTADLRPRMLFAAAWPLAVLAVYAGRPFLEKLVFFGLLLGIREEGIILALFVIALNFLWMRDKPGRWLQTLVFLLLVFAAAGAFLAFMAWGGYNRIDRIYDPRNVLAGLLGANLPLTWGLAGLAAGLVVYVWLRRRHRSHALLLLVYGAALLVTGLQTVRETVHWFGVQSELGPVSVWQVYVQVVTSPTGSLVFYLAILLAALLGDFLAGWVRRAWVYAVAVLALLFAATTLIVVPPQVAAWRANVSPARLVWDFTSTHDRLNTQVLVDYDTYQAFYNFEHVIVYNRLPLWISVPKKRFYPDNRDVVARLIRERLEYAVIARPSLADLQSLAAQAGVAMKEIAGNERYLVMQFAPPAGLDPGVSPP